MNEAMIGVIGTLLGTFLGWGLSEISKYIQARQEFQQQKQGIYHVILLDIDRTLHQLKVANSILEVINYQYRPEHIPALMPIFWNHEMWATQLSLLTKVLTPSQLDTLMRYYSFYEGVQHSIQQLLEMRDPSKFNALLNESKQNNQVGIQLGTELAREIEQLINTAKHQRTPQPQNSVNRQ